MKSKKVWKVVGKEEEYSDLQLKKMIKQGTLKKEDLVYSKEIKDPIKLNDTIYRFYFEEDNNENI